MKITKKIIKAENIAWSELKNDANRAMGILSDNLTKTKMSDIKNIKTGLELVEKVLNTKKNYNTKLSRKQEAFCLEYSTNGFNGLQAYKTVYGCTSQSAQANSSKLLTNTNVKLLVEKLKQESIEKYNTTRESILSDLIDIDLQAKLTDNLKIRVQIAQEKSKLFGLYAPSKFAQTDTKGKDKNPLNLKNLSNEQLLILQQINDNSNS